MTLVCIQLDANQQVEVFNSSKLAENRQNSVRAFEFINGEMHCCCVGNGEYWQLSMPLLVSEKKRRYLLLAGNGKNLGFHFSSFLCLVSFLRSLFVTRNGILFVPFSWDEEKLFFFELIIPRKKMNLHWRKTFLHFYFLIVFTVHSIREWRGLKYIFVRLLLILARF